MSNIPKIIHYCWFGNSKKNKLVQKCLKTWKKNLNDYKLIEWNENNFDVKENEFVKKAYENKKWAFVTDYVRLKVLYEYGGIYFDTDVEVLKSFNDLLEKNFLCFESEDYICTAIMGFKPKSSIIFEFMQKYLNNEFDTKTPNSKHLYTFLRDKYNLNNQKTKFEINDELIIYPSYYFSPKNFYTKKLDIKKDTYCIHNFDGTWKSKKSKFKDIIQRILVKIFGLNNVKKFKAKLKL